MSNIKQNVLIIGGGFAGVKAALELADDSQFAVTLISDQHEFRFYPALYRTATGGSREASAIPLADIFKDKNVRLEYQHVESLDRQTKTVHTRMGRDFNYDVLILALGVVGNYFGIEGLAEYSFGIKSLEEAQKLKEHIHKQLLDQGKPDLNYVVIGGGPTGVELAGELPGYIRRVMKNHGIKNKTFHIDLVELAPRLLPRLPEDLANVVARRLKNLGIELFLGQTVEAETKDRLVIHGESIKSHTVIWTAGTQTSRFYGINGFNLSPKKRVIVDEFLQAAPDIYVLGDNAETPYSGMAQTALHNAIFVANHLRAKANDKKTSQYEPKKPIYVTPAGPYWAAVLWGPLRIYGLLGWLLRRAADFVAYHDLEPWWKASKLWLAESTRHEDCPDCNK